MNYYPATAGWEKMWTEFDAPTISKDFTAIRDLGANTVRIILQPDVVGYPILNATMSARIDTVIDLAWTHGLYVQLTLFDLWGRYNQIDQSYRWMAQVLEPLHDDHRLVLLELQNEINLALPGSIAWAIQLLRRMASLAPGIPRTLSVQSGKDATNVTNLLSRIPTTLLDVIDLHLYGTYNERALILAAASKGAQGRPILVGEAGASTGTDESDASDGRQAAFYLILLDQLRAYHIATFAPWVLSDFTKNGVRSGKQDDPQRFFGLRRLDGTYKMAAEVVRLMFS